MAWGTKEWLLAGAGVGVAVLAWRYRSFTAPAQILAGFALNTFERGARLTHTALDDNGVIPDDPDALVANAGLVLGRQPSSNAYALARMGRSEGVDGMEFRMHVALNDLDELHAHYPGTYRDVAALMLHSKNTLSDGHFSQQGLGKRYATSRDPYEGDYNLALAVMADHAAGVDPTGGAVKFVDKDSFGVQEGADSYEATAASWASDGLEPATLEGASDNFVVFRRVA
jgi:hypothetical protein